MVTSEPALFIQFGFLYPVGYKMRFDEIQDGGKDFECELIIEFDN